MFQPSQGVGGDGRFLLALGQLSLRYSQIVGRGSQNLAVGVAFRLERGQPMLSLRQLRLGRGNSQRQLRATFLVVPALGVGAVRFELELA